jgi:DNA-binding transcriptional MerR regulator
VKLVEVAHEQRRCQIGERAKATGVAVRALRFYDDTGLVRPAAR